MRWTAAQLAELLTGMSGWSVRRGTTGSCSGCVLAATDTPAAWRVPVALRGPHLIALGLFHPREVDSRLYARVEGEDHFSQVRTLRRDASFERVTLGVADLTDRALELGAFAGSAWIDYIEFIPVLHERFDPPDRELLGFLDFNVDAPTSRPAGREAASAVRRHAETGFTSIAWKATAVRCEYRTNVGERRAREANAGPGPSVGALLEQYDTLRQAVDEARRMSLKIYGWMRISNEMTRASPHPFAPTTPFHLANPAKVQLRRDGVATPRLSFAYPEVRRHKAELVAEVASYGVDAILIDTLRHPPMALYDQPLVERFMAERGEDPRTMEGDGTEAWLRFRARHAFTQFLIETRELLEAQGGQRVPIHVRVPDQHWANLAIGCDTADWFDRGLVDGLVLAPWCAESHDYPEAIDAAPFIREARGRASVLTQVWRYGSMAHAAHLAQQAFAQGADGVAVYDSELAVARPGCRESLWRLAHSDLGERAVSGANV